MAGISQSDRSKVAQSVKHAKLIDASRKLARIVKHADPDPCIVKHRKKIEASMSSWLCHHGGEAFASAWSLDHKRILAKIESAINKGGLFALAMPRGHGKTTILKWVTLYLCLS